MCPGAATMSVQLTAHPELQLFQMQFWQNAGHLGVNEYANGDRKDKS